MTPEAVDFYAKKFFPHLMPQYGRLSVQEAWERNKHNFKHRRRQSPLAAMLLMGAILGL